MCAILLAFSYPSVGGGGGVGAGGPIPLTEFFSQLVSMEVLVQSVMFLVGSLSTKIQFMSTASVDTQVKNFSNRGTLTGDTD